MNQRTFLEDFPTIREILQNIEQVVWVLDLAGMGVVYVSPAFETVWGRSIESVYADPMILFQSVHPEDRVAVLAASSIETTAPLNLSYRILRPDGGLCWISTRSFMVNEGSASPRYQVWVSENITKQSQVDLTLRRSLDRSREQFNLSRRMSLARKPDIVLKTLMSASELRSAKSAYTVFFDTPMAERPHEIEVIASWSPSPNQNGNNPSTVESTLFENPAFFDLFHPSRPVIFTEISKDQRLTPGVRDTLLEANIQAVIIFPLVASGSWLGSLVIFFPEGNNFSPVEFRQLKVLVDQAAITLYNLKLLDIEAESRQEAERANEIKTQFLAMISHELRTPLTSIKGFTTTLLAEDVTWEPEEQKDFIRTIHQEANRLQELIDHLLDLSRLEAGMLPILLEPHSFEDILLDAMPHLKAMTQNHVFSLRVPTGLPPVQADSKRIAQILDNLVQNAVRYTPAGTEIVLTAHPRGSFLYVNVVDQGPGIPVGDRKRVFQAFRRGPHEIEGKGKGAGLGLAICKGLVEAHGGRIWIKNHPPVGTTISFTIPLVPNLVPAKMSGKA
jgi:signal transduction histidine kinase